MKKVSRFASAIILSACLASSAQAHSIFSALKDIIDILPEIFNAVKGVPNLAVQTISFATQAISLIGMGPSTLGGSGLSANLIQVSTYQGASTNNTQSYGSQINSNYAGSSDTFSNQLNSYKSGTQTCTTGANGQPTCVSNIDSNTLYNTSNLGGTTLPQHAAAVAYANNASGAGIGLAKPNYSTATPAVVKYNAFYNTQAAIQSNANNNFASAVSERTPYCGSGSGSDSNGNCTTGSGGSTASNNSPKSFLQNAFQLFATFEKYQQELFGGPLGSLVIGPMISAAQTLMGLPHMLGHASDSLDRINSGVSTIQTSGSQSMTYTVGNQLKANADQETSGMPYKKEASE
ncbi:MAG: hypothetical protein A3E87_03140 [Gammaproteobacteria bacterium RIFCSPHIGHO2_12_FULL_35_23]|nr:MAG: hypothetical protein A3E87_03140 [Gammaproteobacteria bacterium RIFCSPHIGHO2_12_FULL_35_23]